MQDVSEELAPPTRRAMDISDTGIITGWMGQTTVPPNYRGFIWDNGRVIDLGYPFPGAFASEGMTVNSRGDVAGRWWRPAQTYPYETRMFLWSNGKMLDCGSMSNLRHTAPLDISDDGTIVGTHFHHTNISFAFIWQDGMYRNLNNLIPPTPELFRIEAAWAINDSGQIICNAVNMPDMDHVAVLLTPVPSKSGDTNCDDAVNVDDLLGVINNWGGYGSADLNNDGVVNVDDLLEVIMNWSS